MKRREFLNLGLGGIIGSFVSSGVAFANIESENRFIFIIQRGAADGLNTLIPYGDPNYGKLRGALAIENPKKLDGMFALHPALSNIGSMFENREAGFFHAIATPYRERSHFDGQNILEGGFSRAYEADDGWLNRFLSLMPQSSANSIAFAPTIPLSLRGKNPSTSYAPSKIPDANEDLLTRVAGLYENDPLLYDIWLRAQATKEIANGANAQNPSEIGKMIADFMKKQNGPRFAMLETNGWDTHSAQDARLNTGLKSVDNLIASIRSNMEAEWAKTTILIATEFGRTAAANGTNGTDHGTASCALVLSGAKNLGKIFTDWPGLRQSDLFEARDLRPTGDLFAIICDTLGKTYNIEPQKVARTIFPNVSVKI